VDLFVPYRLVVADGALDYTRQPTPRRAYIEGEIERLFPQSIIEYFT
jgi:hypothetical protein